MKVVVLAQAFSRTNCKPIGNAREEYIDTTKNELFQYKGKIDFVRIKESYESFWNHLNPKSPSIVFVQSIRKPFDHEMVNYNEKVEK